MSCPFNPLDHPVVFSSPRRLTPFSEWREHIPFAMFLVHLLKPDIIVELGTQYGDSYCAFCQAVQELKYRTRCYAVDTWGGDPQTGYYGPEVLASLIEHHDPLYGSFSSLIKTTFDDAQLHFQDGTIDLLHIDGYHIYEAVKHDFESWLPKMSDKGVVLFHDINVREKDFGVWRLWEELTVNYPHLEFVHGHGLGVLAVGKSQPQAFEALLKLSVEEFLKIRNFFFHMGLRLTLKAEMLAQLNAEKESFNKELEQKEERIGQMAQEVAQIHARSQEQAREVIRQDAHAQELAKLLREKDVSAQALASEVIAQDRHAQELARQVAATDAHAQELAKEIQRLVGECQSKNEEIEKIKADLAAARNELSAERSKSTLMRVWERLFRSG